MMERREEKIRQTVGPGEYEVPEDKGQGVTMGQRLKARDAEEVPAPGQYEVKSKILEGPTYTMGQKREEKILQSVGPGEYETPVEKGKGVTIGQRMQ